MIHGTVIVVTYRLEFDNIPFRLKNGAIGRMKSLAAVQREAAIAEAQAQQESRCLHDRLSEADFGLLR